jgi:hypothetical protein
VAQFNAHHRAPGGKSLRGQLRAIVRWEAVMARD